MKLYVKILIMILVHLLWPYKSGVLAAHKKLIMVYNSFEKVLMMFKVALSKVINPIMIVYISSHI